MSEAEAWMCPCPFVDLEQPPLFPLGGIQQQERVGCWVGPQVPPYQPYALASDLKGMCSSPHGGHWGSDNVLRAHLFKLGIPVSDL